MTDRGLNELKLETTFHHQYHRGSKQDYSDHGYDGIWQAGFEPEFRRRAGQVTALDFNFGGAEFITVDDVPFDGAGEVAVEILFKARSAGGALLGRIFGHQAGGIKDLHFNGAGGNLTFDCGVPLTTAVGSFLGEVEHVIVSRNRSLIGSIYRDGNLVATGAVGANGGTGVLSIGTAFANYFDGYIYMLRLFNTPISVDEAPRLYQQSRIKLWPGAQKRSGIVSAI